jgi:transposase
MGDLSDFQRGQIVGAWLAGAFVTKAATLLGVYRAAVYKVLTTYTHHGRTSSAKRNSGQKPKLNERDCHTLKRIVSINHRSTAAQVTAELNILLEDCFHTNSPMRASQIQHSW